MVRTGSDKRDSIETSSIEDILLRGGSGGGGGGHGGQIPPPPPSRAEYLVPACCVG